MAITRQRAEELRNDPRIQGFLNMIAVAEGTARNGYHTEFGGGRLSDLSDHPRTLHPFTQTDGERRKTTAAGRYQFLAGTWDDRARQLGLEDFGPESQDLAAIAELDFRGALEPLLAGDTTTAVQRASGAWAALPGSTAPQRHRSPEFVSAELARQGLPPLRPGDPLDDLPESTLHSLTAQVADEVVPAEPGLPPEAAILADPEEEVERALARLAPVSGNGIEVMDALAAEQTEARERAEQMLEATGVRDLQGLRDLQRELEGDQRAVALDQRRVDAQMRFAGREPLPVTQLQLAEPLQNRINQILRDIS